MHQVIFFSPSPCPLSPIRTEDHVALVGHVGMAMLVVEGIVLGMAAAVWTFWLLEVGVESVDQVGKGVRLRCSLSL